MEEDMPGTTTSPMAFSGETDSVPYSPVMPSNDDRLSGPYPRRPVTISVGEAAELLGVSEKAIRSAVEKGQIEAMRVGRLIRIMRLPLYEMLGLPEDYEPKNPPKFP